MTSHTPAEPVTVRARAFANAPLLLVFTTMFWGGNAVAGKFAVGEVSPLILTAVRWILSAAVLLIIARPHLRRDWSELRPRLAYLFLLGAFGYAIFNATLYTSLKYTSAINVTILQAAMPMMVFFLNFAIFRTSVHWAQVLGYTVTLFGVALIASGGSLATLSQLSLNTGDILILVATFIYACYSVGLRSRPDVHWLSFMTVLVCAAAITSVAVASLEVASDTAIWPVTPTAWAVILYTFIFPSLIGQAFFARGVQLIGSNRASLFLNLVPVFGAIFAVLLLGENFQLYHAGALALVIGGITIAQNLTPASHKA